MAKKLTGKTEKKLEHQLLWVVGFVVFLIVLYFAANAFFKYLNGFDYEGMHFTKEKYGDKPVYHHYYYYKQPGSNGGVIQYNLYLLQDPRTNNITFEGDSIFFNRTILYVGIDSSYPEYCRDNSAAVVDMTSFLRGNNFIVEIGLGNKTLAREKGMTHVACGINKAWEVVEFIAGNETGVKVNGNCHQIIVGPECRVQDAVEKFKVRAIIDSRLASES